MLLESAWIERQKQTDLRIFNDVEEISDYILMIWKVLQHFKFLNERLSQVLNALYDVYNQMSWINCT